MTAGTRRNGTSKFGPFRRPAAPGYGEFEHQGQEGRFAEVISYGEFGDTAFDASAFDGTAFERTAFDASAFGDAKSGDAKFDDASPDVYAALPTLPTLPAPAAPPATAGIASGGTEPGRNAGRYTGRHTMSPRAKTTRMRVGKVVPVAAVAATIAAGTAAYGLASGGPSQPAHTSATMSLPGTLESTSAASLANAKTVPSGLVKIATATDTGAAQPTGKHAKSAPRRTPAATPPAAASSAAATHAATKASAPAAPKHAAPAVTHASSPATTQAPATALSCNLSYGMLPDNVTAIVSFLLANGYSDNAAAGIAGNIYQESKGNPESEGMGGGGLIGWTPLPAGFVTGNVTTDLQTQLSALLTYNQGWSGYLPALNSAASPSDAAYIYVTDFERAGIPAASTREGAAQNVASACGI